MILSENQAFCSENSSVIYRKYIYNVHIIALKVLMNCNSNPWLYPHIRFVEHSSIGTPGLLPGDWGVIGADRRSQPGARQHPARDGFRTHFESDVRRR